MRGIWPFQYTRAETPLTDALSKALHEYSDGNPSVSVRLYARAQMRLIEREEYGGHGEASLTPDLLRRVSEEGQLRMTGRIARPRRPRPPHAVG